MKIRACQLHVYQKVNVSVMRRMFRLANRKFIKIDTRFLSFKSTFDYFSGYIPEEGLHRKSFRQKSDFQLKSKEAGTCRFLKSSFNNRQKRTNH